MGTHPIFESDFDCLTDMFGVNNMDLIERPTSRVLAAPGGRSSNIFGTDPEPVRTAQKPKQTSNIFASESPKEEEKPKAKKNVPADNNIFAAAQEEPKPPTKPVGNESS